MTPLETVGAIAFVAGIFGVVGWMVTRLQGAYEDERARQAPDRRSSPLLTIVVAVVVYGVLTWLTDYRTAFSLALAGIALAGIVQNIAQRIRNR